MSATPDHPGGGEAKPTAEQRAAIKARDRDVFLEAGAGTGKTRVLVERYCDAVCEDQVAVERILAFTFTERAAAELRERIRRELGRRARAARIAEGPDQAARISHAARDTERAWVATIHGFCRRLLAIHPVAAGIDPRFRVLDEAEATRLGSRAFAAALEELAAAGDGRVTALAAGFRPDRLGDVVRGAHELLRSQGAADPRLPNPGEPVRSVFYPKRERPELSPAEAALARHARDALDELLAAFGHRYEQLKAERSGLDFSDLELRALALLREPGPVREAWRGRFAHLLVDEFQDTNRVQLAIIDALRGEGTRLFTVGDEFQSIYRFRHADLEVFRKRRREADSEPGTERLPLRGNFRARPDALAGANLVGAALLDDFSPLAAALEPLSLEPRAGGPAVELLLTDLDSDRAASSAPGWRGEGIELDPPPSEDSPGTVAEARCLARRLRELADEGVPPGEMVVLLRAFTHVDAFEEALDRAGLDPYVVGGRGYWSQQQVEDLLRLLATVANPLDDEALLGALASPACGASPDALWLLRAAAGRGRHVWPTIEWRFGSSRETGGPAAEHPEQMSFALGPTSNFPSTPSPDRAERHDQFGFALGPTSNFPSTPSPGRAERSQRLDEIPAEDAARLTRFCATLTQLRAAAPLLPLDSLMERAMAAFDYDLSLLARPAGRRRMANVRKLMRLAREFEEHEGRDLRDFLSFAEERTERDEREGQAAIQAEEHDGVRVMTVHAAKGLEFPVVAVADLGRKLTAGASAADLVIGRLDGDLGEARGARFGMRLALPAAESLRLWELVELCKEEELEDAREACRLAYVAATRAEERLILSGTFRVKDLEPEALRASQSALKLLLPELTRRGWSGAEDVVEIEPPRTVSGEALPELRPRLAVRVNRASPERAAALAKRIQARIAAPPSTHGGQPPLLTERAPAITLGHLSYSALAEYARCGYRFYVERVLGLEEMVDPTAGSSEHRFALGNAVHAALEWSARRDWAGPYPDLLPALLEREGLDDEGALELAGHMVDGWLSSSLLADLRATTPRPEVPFALALGGAVVRGKIDLLVELPDALVVVDYKTDALRGGDPRELAARYQTQRAIYALAARGGASKDGNTRPVRTVYCFLAAPERPVETTFDEGALDTARASLTELIVRARSGQFSRTDRPYPSLCYGCPAAERLCSKPAWRPARAALAGSRATVA